MQFKRIETAMIRAVNNNVDFYHSAGAWQSLAGKFIESARYEEFANEFIETIKASEENSNLQNKLKDK